MNWKLARIDVTILAVVFALSQSTVSAAEKLTPTAGTSAAAPAEVDPLLVRVNEAIEVTSRRYLIADQHSPWQILHGVLALRQDFQIKIGDEKSSALDWIAEGQVYDGRPWVLTTRHGGKFHPFTRPWAFEGHPNQFLAILTMSELPEDFAFKTGNRTVTIGDMVQNAKMEVNNREEITWTLWALSFYLDTDAEWVNQYGEPWSIERLVQIQTAASTYRAACGGTHGLFALARARNAHLQSGKQIRGVWVAAEQKLNRYIEITRALQNHDGTFSANHFQSREFSRDFTKRIATSGHILEFLMMAMPQHRLEEPWVRNGIAAVANDLIVHRKENADCGPLYHALHALIVYRDRVQPPVVVALAEPQPVPSTTVERPSSDAAASTEEPSGRINSVEDSSMIDRGEAGAPAVEQPATKEQPASAEMVAPVPGQKAPASALRPANVPPAPAAPARINAPATAKPLTSQKP